MKKATPKLDISTMVARMTLGRGYRTEDIANLFDVKSREAAAVIKEAIVEKKIEAKRRRLGESQRIVYFVVGTAPQSSGTVATVREPVWHTRGDLKGYDAKLTTFRVTAELGHNRL